MIGRDSLRLRLARHTLLSPLPLGRGWRAQRAGRGGQRVQNHFQYAVRIPQNIVVPEPQHAKSFAAKIAVAHDVLLVLCVLPPIDLDDQLSSKAREVNDVRTDRHLPFEFVTVETMSAQPVP